MLTTPVFFYYQLLFLTLSLSGTLEQQLVSATAAASDSSESQSVLDREKRHIQRSIELTKEG